MVGPHPCAFGIRAEHRWTQASTLQTPSLQELQEPAPA
jgi:hypothetical protein